MSDSIEIWVDIKCFEGCYQISSHGRVKSLARSVRCNTRTRMLPEKEMVLHSWKEYQSVWLRTPGVHQKCWVHRLVAQHFIENDDPENKNHVNHKDKNRRNNHFSNLEWMTHEENMHHRDNYKPDEPF